MVMLSAKLPFLSCFQLSFAAFGLAHLRMLPWYKPPEGRNSVKNAAHSTSQRETFFCTEKGNVSSSFAKKPLSLVYLKQASS